MNIKVSLEQSPPFTDRSKLESPLEQLFIESFEKYLDYRIEVIPQYSIKTTAGNFRLDFVVVDSLYNKKIGFECDGQAHHDEWKDEWRDAMILQTEEIDTIYRFRGKDIHTFTDDCVFLIYYYDKSIFNERYQFIYPNLISREALNTFTNNNIRKHESNTIYYHITDENGKIHDFILKMERRSKEVLGHWKVLQEFAINNPGCNLEELMNRWKVNSYNTRPTC